MPASIIPELVSLGFSTAWLRINWMTTGIAGMLQTMPF
jgi:hypothetical protein